MRPTLQTMIPSPASYATLAPQWPEARGYLTDLVLAASAKSMTRWTCPDSCAAALVVDGWLRAARIGNAYARRFRRAWATSAANTRAPNKMMCTRESEFFDLVASRLPTVGWSNYFWGSSNRPTQIVLQRCTYEWHLADEFSACDPVVLALEYLAAPDSFGATALWSYLRGKLPCKLPRLHERYAWLDCRVFRLRAVRTGIKQFVDLSDAFNVINASTGNRFLDAEHDDAQPVGWIDHALGISATAVRTLEREWAEAQSLLKRVPQSAAWLARNPARWPDVIGMVEVSLSGEPRGDP